ASDCLAELDRHEPDLVMLDLMMPIVSGLDLCRLIRSSARWCELPLVAVTAWTDPEVRATAYRAGADDYLAKPLVEEELGARIVKRAQRASQDRDVRERDGLTDLLLRSPFLHRTEQLLAAARRRAASFCVAMVDIDHFKQVNDTHGHLVGDQVLAAVGRILRQGVRTEDFCARWGGEEFAIALVGSSTDQAQRVLHRLLDTVQAFGFNGAQNQIFHVSFSGGVACSETTPGNASTLIAQADQALYRAKAAGRQRILS
ncbi:MAG: diguanylate cyclase, partial [Oligoflexia bacterium]|nr:diguanylate cyclase [Oligoflexia bacterium]